MIPTIAMGDRHDVVLGSVSTVVAAIDVKTRRIEMCKLGSEAQALRGLGGDEALEGSDPIGIASIQAPPEPVIVEIGRCNPRPYEALGRFVLNKAGDQVEWVIHAPQTMKDHGFDCLAEGDSTLRHILRNSVIHDGPYPQCLKHALIEF